MRFVKPLLCQCGHYHNEHNEQVKTHNYTAGKCYKCDCKYFVHNPIKIRRLTPKDSPTDGQKE